MTPQSKYAITRIKTIHILASKTKASLSPSNGEIVTEIAHSYQHSTYQKAPPCSECLFVKYQRRSWRIKGKKNSIRKKDHSASGKRTSDDHMISHQTGIIPQVTVTLTHDRYWGTVTTVYHTSIISYSHLIKITSNSESLEAKDTQERGMCTYGHRVESYHADNSIFK